MYLDTKPYNSEYVKIVIESVHENNGPEVKTNQLMKFRTNSLWSGQEYDMRRIK